MKRKILSLMLCLVLMCSILPSAGAVGEVAPAALPEDSVIMPRYSYTSGATTTINISGSTATCYASIKGYNGITTKVSITMTLQKKSWLTWNDVETWKISTNTYYTQFSKTRSIESGTYRVKAVYTAYSGTASETFTIYSGSDTY